MNRLKRLLRVNTLALDFKNVYSILDDQYFSILTPESIVNIPFFNLLYKSYPDVLKLIFRNNVNTLYGYILLIRHPFFEELVKDHPESLVQAIKIALEQPTDIFKLNLSTDLLDDYIGVSSLDSFLAVDVNVEDIPPTAIERSGFSDRSVRAVIKYLTARNKLQYLEIDKPTNTEDLIRHILTLEDQSIITRWGNRIKTYLLKLKAKIETQADYDSAFNDQTLERNQNVSLMTEALESMKVSRILLHNIMLSLYAKTRNLNDLYSAFKIYPYMKTLSDQASSRVLTTVVPVDFFRSPRDGLDFYLTCDTEGVRLRAPEMIDIRSERPTAQLIKHSILDEIDEVVETPYEIMRYNTLQIRNRLLRKPYNSMFDRRAQPVAVGVIDIPLLCAMVDGQVSLLPSKMTFTSLTETLETYLPLIPDSSIAAILLLLLYNSSNHLAWIEIYKKHSEIMLTIIQRSSILSAIEKRDLLQLLATKPPRPQL